MPLEPAARHVDGCIFCRITSGQIPASIIADDDALVAFLDINPIRPGHVQIVPRAHYPYFDEMPPDIAARIIQLGQKVARAQKAIWGVKRVGFMFTGTDIAHVHGHVIPIVEFDDLTSRRYIAEEVVTYRLPPRPSQEDMAGIAARLKDELKDR